MDTRLLEQNWEIEIRFFFIEGTHKTLFKINEWKENGNLV